MPGPPSFEEVADPEVEDTETTEATTTDEVDVIEVTTETTEASTEGTEPEPEPEPEPEDELTMLVNDVLIAEPAREVTVNDKTFPCVEGTPTEGGFYKNGWTTTPLEGKKGKHTYLRWVVFTSAAHQVDIEMKAMFRLKSGKWSLCQLKGWHGVDLIKLDERDALKYTIDYLRECRQRQEAAEVANVKAFYIHVTTLAGVKFKFLMRPSDTVLAVKEKITKRARKAKGPTVPPHDQRLHFAVGGKMTELENDETLGHYNIKSGSTLSLVLCLRGGSDTASGGMPHREAAAAAEPETDLTLH